MKRFFAAGLLFVSAFSVGCGQADLHHNLKEVEADQILVVLNQNGIDAKKEKEMSGQDVSWKITVDDKKIHEARRILVANHLPRERAPGLSDVYQENKGLIPTPDEQKALSLLALKGEIVNSLLKIPGVVDVGAVLNVPTENEFSTLDPVKKKPTASVVVKTRNDPLVAQTITESKLQQFVANTVPNLDPNDVVVIVSRTDTGALPMAIMPIRGPGVAPGVATTPTFAAPPMDSDLPAPEDLGESVSEVVQVAGVKMDPASVGRFKLYIVGLLILLVGVSGFLLFNIMRLNRMKLGMQRAARGSRGALGGGQSPGLLREGRQGTGMESGFEVGATERVK